MSSVLFPLIYGIKWPKQPHGTLHPYLFSPEILRMWFIRGVPPAWKTQYRVFLWTRLLLEKSNVCQEQKRRKERIFFFKMSLFPSTLWTLGSSHPMCGSCPMLEKAIPAWAVGCPSPGHFYFHFSGSILYVFIYWALPAAHTLCDMRWVQVNKSHHGPGNLGWFSFAFFRQ